MNKACKDCIHYNLCQRLDACFEYYNAPSPIHLPETCSACFKDKSRFIELPCAVGDKAWWLTTANWQQTEWKTEEVRVSMLQQKADKSWKIRLTHNSSVFDITTEDIGKTVFLTKEEAENALKEKE